jgi:Ca-activated chloride channel homolog
MQFENPALLNLLWGLLLHALLLFIYWQWRKNTLRRLGSPALEQRLLQGFSNRRFWLKNGLFALAMVILVVAMANPQRAVRVQPQLQNSADILIALDVSNSMLAKDVSPNRLGKAKDFIRKLADALKGERLGLIFFAGDAHPQTPLATDYSALLMFLHNANPAIIADQGTDVAAAVEQATRMFETDTKAGRALIIVSDGENHQENAVRRAQQARADGIQIHTVGVGSPGGAMIPAEGGRMVRTTLNEPFLRELATAGGGGAYNLSEDARVIGALKNAVRGLQKDAVLAQGYTEYRSYFQWLLLPVMLLLILEQVLWWKRPEHAAS